MDNANISEKLSKEVMEKTVTTMQKKFDDAEFLTADATTTASTSGSSANATRYTGFLSSPQHPYTRITHSRLWG